MTLLPSTDGTLKDKRKLTKDVPQLLSYALRGFTRSGETGGQLGLS